MRVPGAVLALPCVEMQERDLIAGVIAVQAGFVSPSQVLTAVAAGLVDAGSDSLLIRLERAGALGTERSKIVDALVEQTLLARSTDRRPVSTSPQVPFETQVSAAGDSRTNEAAPACLEIPLERPGRYTRMHELGRGGQSVVRVARDEIVGREVALKELVTPSGPSGHGSSSSGQARFLREVRLVASLEHPGIVPVLDVARREDGTLFCAQKLIRGETLQTRLALCRTLANRLQLLRYVLDACQTMAFAHSKHVIHRDLKPANVMVDEDGETVIIDWGLAKHQDEAEESLPSPGPSAEPLVSTEGSALGTPAYMSPEQARGDLATVDTRSDVFSLGALLYQVLTGRPPFEGATSDQIVENVKAGEFHPVRMLAPDAPPELTAIAERALQPEPSDRYRDAGELARELKAYLTGGRVKAYRYGALESLRKFAARRRTLMAAVAIAFLGIFGSAGIVELGLQARATPDGAVAAVGAARAQQRPVPAPGTGEAQGPVPAVGAEPRWAASTLLDRREKGATTSAGRVRRASRTKP